MNGEAGWQRLYRGSVKDLLGPVSVDGIPSVIFEYTDAFSVFDWGRMPDLLPGKGVALATLSAWLFESLEKPENWKEFSRTKQALGLRKGSRFGSSFNELGERLQETGLKTHYLGVLSAQELKRSSGQSSLSPVRLETLGTSTGPIRHLVVRQVSATPPVLGKVLGRSIPDYSRSSQASYPRLVPLEVVFRFSCPEGSSLLDRVRAQPDYLASLGFPDASLDPGALWEFPVLELFTKLESSDRVVSLPEALPMSGLSAEKLEEMLFRTAWVAGFLRALCAKSGIELADGKLEWGVDQDGTLFLVDAVGPDELRLLSSETQLSKEFLRGFYRKSAWYRALNEAKAKAQALGQSEWKRGLLNPPNLTPEYHEAGAQLYQGLTEALTGRKWFPSAWPLEQTLSKIRSLQAGESR